MDIELTEEEKIKILDGDDLYKIMQKILLRENKIDRDREHFWIVGLANNKRLLFIELISLGTINKVLVEAIEVFSFALQKRAVSIILVHNHPSGELKPSKTDLDLTDKLIQAGRIVNTEILDHLIITENSFLSFKELGILAELEQSTKYVTAYEIEQRLRKEFTLSTKEKVKNETIKIAKKLKMQGMENKLIAEITGLSFDEIEKIIVSKK